MEAKCSKGTTSPAKWVFHGTHGSPLDPPMREDQFVTHQQRWTAKVRRRSSDMKSFVSDKLELADNPKITAIMNKNGMYSYLSCEDL